MRILDRYIIREIGAPFLLGLAVFTLILLVARVLKLVELVVNRGVPFTQVAMLFSYILPSFLEVTIPMAMLLATMVALGRLSADSEVVAMRSCGISLLQIARPIAIVATFTFLLALSLSLFARPWGNSLLREGLFDIAKVRASAGIRPRVFTDDFSGLVLYVDHIEPPGNVLQGVLISGDFDPSNELAAGDEVAAEPERTTVVAKAGVLISNEDAQVVTLRLFEGSLHSIDSARQTYHRTDFGTYEISLDMNIALADLKRHEKEPKEIATRDIIGSLQAPAGTNGEPDGSTRAAYEVELARRVSLPFACLGFAALAIPLGIRPSSAARSRSFAISLGLIFSYYLLLTLGESLAERSLLPPHFALWIPNLALFSLAAILFRRASSEVPVQGRHASAANWLRNLRDRARSRVERSLRR